MALARELLEPYFTRTIIASDPRRFMIRHGWTLLGFSLPFVLIFAIPVLGLFFAGYANGAAAVVLSDLWFADRRNGVELDTDRRPSLDKLDTHHMVRRVSDGDTRPPLVDTHDRVPPALDRIDSTDSQSSERHHSRTAGLNDIHSDHLPSGELDLDRLDSHDVNHTALARGPSETR